MPCILGIVLFALMNFNACKNDIKTVKEITSIEKYPTLQAEKLRMFRTDSGRVTMKLKTPLMQKYSNAKEPYIEFPGGGVLKMFDENKEVTTYISANYAIYKEQKGKWIARNDVEILDKKGRIINTEYVVFDEKKGKIYSDRFTKFTDEKSIIYGKGFESDMNLSNAQIFEPTGFIYPDEEQYETKD